ncbi:restriction endonuclease subunit S [Ferruginibacter paludis]|uniref:restriction endonuclease subunit S n=1 Tax=Ferruginibacter paludis TaxID=1310417 RepID=UPI0025B36B00|nr:restriction endonuclease subunit S [Ferruginibacter paludis]MDN3655409.1 restriction endonuclease subunit S [Ferruginibacter paludis]
MNLTAYDKYKDLGVAWFGALPLHWEVKRNKNIFYEVSQLSKSGEETLLTVSHITGVTLRSEKNVNMFFAETMEGYKICKKGDLIINTMWAWMGALGTSKYYGICSPAYNVYRNVKGVDYNPEYFEYLFRIPNSIMEMTRYSKGIVSSRLRLYPKDFFQILSPVPPIQEQNSIAVYLNKKSTAIDRKISLLEVKISHYKELSRKLINNIVRKGLQKDIPLKESGIECIGKIPEHWIVERLKALGDIETSSVNKKIEGDEVLVRLVNYTDVYGNANKEIWNDENYMVVSANKLQQQYKKLKKGDVLFTPSSETIEDIGVSAVVMEDLKNTLYSYHILRLKFKKEIHLNFKKYLFNNDFVQEYFSKSATGTTRKILGLNTFYNLTIVFPPSQEEQIKIASYLDTKTQMIDKITMNIARQIEGLKELRKSLINDVATGKLKVTGT